MRIAAVTVLGLSLCGSLLAVQAQAQSSSPPATQVVPPPPQDPLEKGSFNFVLENDLFYERDRHYTNGVQFSWTSARNDVPDWVREGAHSFPFFPPGGTVRASYALGQNMYTPSDISLRDPPRDDRPYAGWLYGAVGLVAENGVALDQVQLALGMVGPASLAEPAQKFVHNVIDSREPKGWNTQLHNEPGFILSYQHSQRAYVTETVLGLGFDLTPHVGGALGNVLTYANAGATIRVGQYLPNDYGPPRIQPTLPGSGFFEPRSSFGWYLFVGADGRAVGRNIFLDGNTFGDSRSVDKELFVGDLQGGLALTYGDARLTFTRVYRTREFKSQDDPDVFGSVSLSLRF
jgi:lipid A 3-O-deacylase